MSDDTNNRAADEQVLTLDDLSSGAWLRISAHLVAKLDEYRKKNDGNLAPDRTAELRGRIAEVKRILALDPRIKD